MPQYRHIDGSVWPPYWPVTSAHPVPPPPRWVIEQMKATRPEKVTAEARKTLHDVPPDTWLTKPRKKGGQPEAVPIADLPLMQLVNILKRLIREARSGCSLVQTPIEALAHLATTGVPQLYALSVEARKRDLRIWPPYYHEAFIAALMALRLGQGRRG